MQNIGPPRDHPKLKQLVAQASQALARLDAGRLEELALSCQLLNRDIEAFGAEDRIRLAREAREATRDMALFARVLEVTRGNLNLMNRLRELRAGRLEYSETQARGWSRAESSHGDN
jgi:hypothetical protein